MTILVLGLVDLKPKKISKIDEFTTNLGHIKSSPTNFQIIESRRLTAERHELAAIDKAEHLILYFHLDVPCTDASDRLLAQRLRTYINHNKNLDIIIVAATDNRQDANLEAINKRLQNLLDSHDKERVKIGLYLTSQKEIADPAVFASLPDKKVIPQKTKQATNHHAVAPLYDKFRIQSVSPSYLSMLPQLGHQRIGFFKDARAVSTHSATLVSTIKNHPWFIGGMTLISSLGGGLTIGTLAYCSALTLSFFAGPIGTAVFLGLTALILAGLAAFFIAVGIGYFYDKTTNTNPFPLENYLFSEGDDSELEFDIAALDQPDSGNTTTVPMPSSAPFDSNTFTPQPKW